MCNFWQKLDEGFLKKDWPFLENVIKLNLKFNYSPNLHFKQTNIQTLLIDSLSGV